MIIYHNRDAGFILAQKVGSVLLSQVVLAPALFSSCLCVALLVASDEKPLVKVSKDVAKNYATLLGFVIVFRTSMAFGRFYDGISKVQVMFSKWRDAFTSLAAFIETSIAHQSKRGNAEAVSRLLLAKARLLHWFTLLAALAVQELQMPADPQLLEEDQGGDDGVSRLCVQPSPINRLSDCARVGRKPPRTSCGLAYALNAPQCGIRNSEWEEGIDQCRFMKNQKPRRPSVVSRTSRLSRSSSMTSALSNFDSSPSTGRISMSSRHSSKSPPKTWESVSVRAASVSDQHRRCAVYAVGELTAEELDQIYGSHDHVLTVLKWILLEVSMLSTTGSLLIAPPILSRVYQEVSYGMMAFNITKMKISVVPFPFPFAQLLCYALYAFYMLCPFLVVEIMEEDSTKLEQMAIPVLLNFAACIGYAAVNEIAVEIEMPFGFDANDYPAHGQQNLIVKTMEDTYFAHAPTDFNLGFFSGGCERVQHRGCSSTYCTPPDCPLEQSMHTIVNEQDSSGSAELANVTWSGNPKPKPSPDIASTSL